MKGYKTLIVFGLTALVGVFELATKSNVVPAEYQPYVLLGLGVLGVVLRWVTDTPVFSAK